MGEYAGINDHLLSEAYAERSPCDGAAIMPVLIAAMDEACWVVAIMVVAIMVAAAMVVAAIVVVARQPLRRATRCAKSTCRP